jgi:FkbH-like protein
MTLNSIPSRKFLLVSDFNVRNLSSLLEHGGSIDPVVAPYGQVAQTLLSRGTESWPDDIAGAIVWNSPSSVSPSFERALRNEHWMLEEVLSDVDEFAQALCGIPAHVQHVFVASCSPLHQLEARRGLLDLHPAYGIAGLLMRINLRLADRALKDPRIHIFDSARWMNTLGDRAWDARLWYRSKTPYAIEVFRGAARDFTAALRGLSGSAKKVIVLDLDNTLWGGVVGDIGWQKLRLGGHDPIGEAYRDFQIALKSLVRRGVLLALVSKNDEATALQAIGSHPEMVLTAADFAGYRINWDDKAVNIVALADELNLGLDALVFIDDHPVERARVRETLPRVLVPDWPSSPLSYAAALRGLECFDAPLVSDEDRGRAAMYLAERERRKDRQNLKSLDEWLATLDLVVTVEELSESNLERTAQLLNKTNQLNLRTRRLSVGELAAWAAGRDNHLLVFRVSDRFGDYGLVGIGSVRIDRNDRTAHLEDFVLSCRVMGRRVEQTMLHALALRARGCSASTLIADFLPTARNKPCLLFLQSSSMQSGPQSEHFWLDLSSDIPCPGSVRLIQPSNFDRSAYRASADPSADVSIADS